MAFFVFVDLSVLFELRLSNLVLSEFLVVLFVLVFTVFVFFSEAVLFAVLVLLLFSVLLFTADFLVLSMLSQVGQLAMPRTLH